MTDENVEAEKMKFDFRVEDLIDTKLIAAKVAEKINQDVANSVVWKIQQFAEEAVVAALKPEVVKLIEAQKEQILQEVAKATPQIAKAIATKMVLTANEKLNGYYGKDIISKLFGG